jgi:hypothetical protein
MEATSDASNENGHGVDRWDIEDRYDNVRGKEGGMKGKRRTNTLKKSKGLVATGHRHKENACSCESVDSYLLIFHLDLLQIAHHSHHALLIPPAPTGSHSCGISTHTTAGASRTHGRATWDITGLHPQH